MEFRTVRAALLLLVLLLASTVAADDEVAPPAQTDASRVNGFSLDALVVERSEIIAGGPQRDGIRSVDEPEFANVAEARKWVAPDNPVIGVAIGEEAFAYPIHLMEHHQVVNQRVGGRAIAVTYDPLTDAAVAYEARVGDADLQFGVSGLVHQSNFLMYDRESESLWSQMQGRAISGPRSGRRLVPIRTRVEPLGAWLSRHPASKVLVRPELKKIDYRYSPYAAYWVSKELVFPVPATDDRFHPKEVALGLEVGGAARAYLGSILTASGGRIIDDFAGRKVRIAYDSGTGTFMWEIPEDVRVTAAYWFAWKAFHSETEVWNDGGSSDDARKPRAD